MANVKKPTHVVTHPRLYINTSHGLEHVEMGTELTLTQAQADNLIEQGKVQKIAKKKAFDLTSKAAEPKAD